MDARQKQGFQYLQQLACTITKKNEFTLAADECQPKKRSSSITKEMTRRVRCVSPTRVLAFEESGITLRVCKGNRKMMMMDSPLDVSGSLQDGSNTDKFTQNSTTDQENNCSSTLSVHMGPMKKESSNFVQFINHDSPESSMNSSCIFDYQHGNSSAYSPSKHYKGGLARQKSPIYSDTDQCPEVTYVSEFNPFINQGNPVIYDQTEERVSCSSASFMSSSMDDTSQISQLSASYVRAKNFAAAQQKKKPIRTAKKPQKRRCRDIDGSSALYELLKTNALESLL